MRDEDLYTILGVPSDDSQAEIRRTFRRLARSLHPDTGIDPRPRTGRFAAVVDAHRTLGDPRAGAEYERSEPVGRPGGRRVRVRRVESEPVRSGPVRPARSATSDAMRTTCRGLRAVDVWNVCSRCAATGSVLTVGSGRASRSVREH